jgi:hypothetical protein
MWTLTSITCCVSRVETAVCLTLTLVGGIISRCKDLSHCLKPTLSGVAVWLGLWSAPPAPPRTVHSVLANTALRPYSQGRCRGSEVADGRGEGEEPHPGELGKVVAPRPICPRACRASCRRRAPTAGGRSRRSGRIAGTSCPSESSCTTLGGTRLRVHSRCVCRSRMWIVPCDRLDTGSANIRPDPVAMIPAHDPGPPLLHRPLSARSPCPLPDDRSCTPDSLGLGAAFPEPKRVLVAASIDAEGDHDRVLGGLDTVDEERQQITEPRSRPKSSASLRLVPATKRRKIANATSPSAPASRPAQSPAR